MGTNGVLNRCSAAYRAGEAFGFVNGLAIGWAQGTRAAARAATPNNWSNFSHSLFPREFLKKFDNVVAKWLNKPGNRLNGDFVPAELHGRMDPKAFNSAPADWKLLYPLFSPIRQAITASHTR